MVEEAERFKADDDEARQTVEAKNQLDSYVYGVKNSLDSNSSMSDDAKVKLRAEIQKVVDWTDNNHHATKEEFQAQLNDFQEVYKQLVASTAQEPQQPQQASRGPVVEEVD